MVWGEDISKILSGGVWLRGSKSITVRDCFGSEDWNWTTILGDEATGLPGLSPSISKIKEKVNSYHLRHSLDMIGWRWGEQWNILCQIDL